MQRAGLADYVSFNRTRSDGWIRTHGEADIDFLFIHGDHSIGGCLSDFVNYYPLVRPGGHVLLHDIYPKLCGWPGPRHLLDHYLADNGDFEIVEIATAPNYGMALVRKIDDASSLRMTAQLRAAIRLAPYRMVNAINSIRPIRHALKSWAHTLNLYRAGLY